MDLKSSKKSRWLYHHGQTTLKLLKVLSIYTTKWSTDEDKSKHLGLIPTDLADGVSSFATLFSSSCLQGDHQTEGALGRNLTSDGKEMEGAVTSYYRCIIKFHRGISNILDESSKVRQDLPIGDYLSFDELVTSVQEYLQSLPLELDSFFNFYTNRKPSEWLPSHSRQMEGYYNTTARKLESFKRLICNFAEQCGDMEKLKPLLGRAGVVVLRIASWASWNQSYLDPFDSSFPQRMLGYSFGLSEEFSPHNPDVVEIYRGVVEEYVEVIRMAKPETRVNCMTFEDPMSSFFNFILSAENQACILGDLLEVPVLDLVAKPDDFTEDIQLLLKRGFAAAATEAGSLNYSGCATQVPSIESIRKISFMFSSLMHKLKLIKAEIFLLELHKQKSIMMVPINDWIAAIREAMRSLVNFFKTPKEYMEDSEKSLLAVVKAVVRQVGSLYTSYDQAGSFTENAILNSSLAMFKLFKAEARLAVLTNKNASLKFLAKYRMETLHKSLIFLRALLSDPTDNLVGESCSTLVEAMISEATSLVCSFGDSKMEKHRSVGIALHHSQLRKVVGIHFEEVQVIYEQGLWSSLSNSPKSDGVACIDFLLAQMRGLLVDRPDTVAFMKEQVKILLEELELLRTFLKDAAGHHENKDLQTRLSCLMYEGEYIVDLFVAGDIPVWYHQLVLFIVIEEIKFLKFYMDDKRCDDSPVQGDELTSSSSVEKVEARDPTMGEVIVGLDHRTNNIVDKLRSGSRSLQFISLVGMAGIGKTTLAKKIYNDYSTEHHFHVRAWCYISPVYQKKGLFLDILSYIVELTDEIKGKDEEDLALKLKQSLKMKKYLIVLDDIWSIEPLNYLKNSFPDDKMGSRILLTSRLRDVALQCNSEPQTLSLLSDKESWELLKKKIFHQACCPEDLVEVGWQIAENCKGLPLAIVVVAGLLNSTEKKREWWKEVAKHLRERITDDQESQFMDILEFSYNHLPTYLRPCFLYLGIFLEDQEIPVQKLKRLWISEGFIPKTKLQRVEETAENYLMDLIGRSLVIGAKKSSLGDAKTCRMHDRLRDLCLKKAREENFMQLISTHNGGNSQSHYPSDFAASMQYRLCIHSSKEHFVQSIPFGPHVHTLLFFALSSSNSKGSRHSNDIPSISSKFRLLRVLDLEDLPVGETFLKDIDLMCRLSYLALRGNITSIPSSIYNLWSLETLIVKGLKGEVELPETIWDMPRLRHIQVNNISTYSLSYLRYVENSVVFDNLETFSTPVLPYGKETDKLLRRLTKLRKLRCIFAEHRPLFRESNVLPAMDSLTTLESLKIFDSGRISFPCEISFPPNLKKLTLSNLRMPWTYMSEIQKLPNLEVLKIMSKAFKGTTWDMDMIEGGEFPSLIFLKLEGLEIAVWNASSDHFPKLQHLVLRSCKKLEVVPSAFGESSTLEIIEAHWCTPAAAYSIGLIQKDQLDYGNVNFKVSITPPEWDSRNSA